LAAEVLDDSLHVVPSPAQRLPSLDEEEDSVTELTTLTDNHPDHGGTSLESSLISPDALDPDTDEEGEGDLAEDAEAPLSEGEKKVRRALCGCVKV
jgi:hypothetical protein